MVIDTIRYSLKAVLHVCNDIFLWLRRYFPKKGWTFLFEGKLQPPLFFSSSVFSSMSVSTRRAVSPSSVDAGRSYLKCSHVYLVLKHMRVTHSVINCFGKPAPVLRLSPHSLVYSGTVSLNQPPLSLSLSLASFRCLSTSLSLAACPLSPILCLSLPVRRWGEYLLPSRLGTRAYPHMHVCGPSGSLV